MTSIFFWHFLNVFFVIQDTSVVEKRRSLQAKKQRLLKGLETLMRMAPDVVAQRPGGANDDDWLSPDGSDGAALMQQGNGRYVPTAYRVGNTM